MGSLVRLATKLEQKKTHVSAMRRKSQRDLVKAKKTLQRSTSGLSSIERSISGARNRLAELSESLSQYTERENSIKSLITNTHERLAREITMKKEASGDLEREFNEERRRPISQRIDSISDTIAHLELEIRSRKKMLKKIQAELVLLSKEKTKLSSMVKRKQGAKPDLVRRVSVGRKQSATLERSVSSKSRQEDSALKSLKKVRGRISELTLKKRSASAKKAAKKRKATKRKAPKRKAKTTKKRTVKRKASKRKTKVSKKRTVKRKAPKRKTKTTKKRTVKRKAPKRKAKTTKTRTVKRKAPKRKSKRRIAKPSKTRASKKSRKKSKSPSRKTRTKKRSRSSR